MERCIEHRGSMNLAPIVKFLDSKLQIGEEAGPTRLRLLLCDLASLKDEAYDGDEIHWLVQAGHLGPGPDYVWRGACPIPTTSPPGT